MAASSETTADNIPAENPLVRLREAFNRLSNQQKILFMVAVAALFALLIGSTLWSRQPEWKVLFSNLSEKDGGAIVTLLEQQNIPHRMSDSGSIMVSSERVHETRLKLASQGLPRGGMVGFELMENQRFGTSQFAEQVNYQRGLEGELARTIQSIATVQNARVHLAIPKPSVFVREEQKPTASVLLSLYPGRSLEPSQIAGITHLVSSSVPHLNNANVTVLDQNGSLISQLKSKLQEAGLDPTQIKYVREIEEGIIKRIEEILKPLFGNENFKVQVSADIDFSQSEQTAETYRPNSTPENTSIRSRQNNETASVNQSTGGVPGALTNQPPVPATAPLTQPATGTPPNQAGKSGQAQGQIDTAGVTAPLNTVGQPLNASRSSTTNFEVDKTIRYTKQSVGSIRRLTAAVVVNHRKELDKSGKSVSTPLPEAELKQVNDLVREAMGFSKERGDSISVANSPFNATEKLDNSPPIWKDPENIAYAKELFKYLLIGAIVAFLYLKIIQPSLKTMFPPPPEPEEEPSLESIVDAAGNVVITGEGTDGAEDEDDNSHMNNYAAKLQKARDIAQADPKAVANMIKDWMGLNAA